jgi:hypothetical protein
MGGASVALLLKRIGGFNGPPQTTRVTCRIITGDTTAPARQSIRQIAQHNHKHASTR